jgi:hypothetical protein
MEKMFVFCVSIYFCLFLSSGALYDFFFGSLVYFWCVFLLLVQWGFFLCHLVLIIFGCGVLVYSFVVCFYFVSFRSMFVLIGFGAFLSFVCLFFLYWYFYGRVWVWGFFLLSYAFCGFFGRFTMWCLFYFC